jgi:hypothetical protein
VASQARADGARAGRSEKKVPASGRGFLTGREFSGEIVRHHHYRVQQVLLVISLGVSAATSLRGAGRALAVLQQWAGVEVESPSWSSTR